MSHLEDNYWKPTEEPRFQFEQDNKGEPLDENFLELHTATSREKGLEEIAFSAYSSFWRVATVVFSAWSCFKTQFPDRWMVDYKHKYLISQTFVSHAVDTIAEAEKRVRGKLSFFLAEQFQSWVIGTCCVLWRNARGAEYFPFERIPPSNNHFLPNTSDVFSFYKKIQHYIFSCNFSCRWGYPLFLDYFGWETRQNNINSETRGETLEGGVSAAHRTLCVSFLPVVQFFRAFSFIFVRLPNPSLTFRSENDENDDAFRLTANMGEESFDDLLSLQETPSRLARPADSFLIERCTAVRIYRKDMRVYYRREQRNSRVTNDRRSKSDTMLFRYGQDYCPVCLETYGNRDMLRVLPCLHFFHLQCIDRWLLIDKSCPLCKWDIDQGLLYSSWEETWYCEHYIGRESFEGAPSSPIDLIEQDTELKWGEWFRNVFFISN